jgi:hypothetical protein
MTDKLLIKISDLNLASTLLCLGHDILGIDNINPKRVFFYFDQSDKTTKSIKDYWSDSVKVNPKVLANYRRELLSRIYQEDAK